MAREESSREDLLREATALVERIELRITSPMAAPRDREDHVVAGFRANGAASFFFGDDPVYQFNSVGQLRRGYCGGLLFKAAHGRLVSLQRVRLESETQLLSHQLTDSEQLSFTGEMQTRLRELAGALQNSCFEVIGQVPAEADVLERVRSGLATHDGLPVAATPGAG
jgi:hypothetical protein